MMSNPTRRPWPNAGPSVALCHQPISRLTPCTLQWHRATLEAAIGDTTAKLLVVYPHGGLTDAELRAELLVIRSWFVVFNGNGADINGKLPNSTQSFPVSVVLTTSDLHVSDTSPNERVHITGRLSTTMAWALNPKENNSCVHIYAKNNDLADGYDSRLLKNKSKSKLSSSDIQTKVAAALANNRGVLGQGNLASGEDTQRIVA